MLTFSNARRMLAAVLLVVSLPAPAAEVTNIRPLLIQAIRTGQAEGTLGGQAKAFFRREFASDAPIRISVKRLHPLKTAGCARLEVTTKQDGVLDRTKDGAAKARSDAVLAYQVNFCENGRFPEEGGGR